MDGRIRAEICTGGQAVPLAELLRSTIRGDMNTSISGELLTITTTDEVHHRISKFIQLLVEMNSSKGKKKAKTNATPGEVPGLRRCPSHLFAAPSDTL